MKRLLTDSKVGEYYLRGDGRKCILVSRTEEHKFYKYRFRLVEDHEKWMEILNNLSKYGFDTHSSPYDFISFKPIPQEDGFEQGDWTTKASGIAADGKSWCPQLNIISKVE